MREEIVSIRVSSVEKKMLKKAAREMGCPLSDAIRWALRRELAETPKIDQAARTPNQAGR